MSLLVHTLCVVLVASAGPADISTSLSKWRAGQRIEVELNANTRLVGRLGPVESQSFVLIAEDSKHTPQNLRFDDVRSVRAKMTRRTKWTIGLVIYGVIQTFALILGK